MSTRGGLADATNRQLPVPVYDKASDTPMVELLAKKVRRKDLSTPPTDEGADASQLGAASQQPRMQRLVRTRKRHDGGLEPLADAENNEGGAADGPRQQHQPSRVRKRLQPDQPQDGEDGENVEGAGGGGGQERPQKRQQREQTEPDREQEPQEDPQEEAHDDEMPDEPGPEFPRKVGSAGHIARIHLENFMCHRNFELDIGTHVTLVSGTNGSGKSAVMQALQVCLGATARETGRGTSLAGFIRTGALDAKVQVTLWNTGADAFMPDTFGNRITVERVIKPAGASPYNLLDVRMRKAALNGEKPRDVLDRMLDHFSLDASNPLTIITQDMARQFLAANKDDALKKYEVFMQSTLMDKTQYNIKAANADVSTMMQRFNETANAYNEAKKEQAELKSRVEKLRSADQQLQDRDTLEKAAAWRAVQQLEERMAGGKQAVETHGPHVIELYDRHLAAIEAEQSELTERKQTVAEQLRSHQSAMDNHTAHVESLVQAQRAAKVNAERAKRAKQAAQNDLDRLYKDTQELNERLEKEGSGQAAEARRLVEEHQQQVTAKQAAVHAVQEAVAAASQALETARNEVHNIARQEQAARQHVQKSAANVEGCRTGLQRLAANLGNRLALFRAVELNQLIDRNLQRFTRRPIGPLGIHITVSEDKWLLAVDVALDGAQRDYLVSCAQDAVLLRQLMQRAGYQRAAVVTVKFTSTIYDIPQARLPANGFSSLLDVVMVQDAEARGPIINYLIDRQKLESVALADTAVRGRSVIYENQAGAHICVAIDTDGNWYKRNGDFRYVSRSNKKREQCTLVADMSAYMVNMERDLEQFEAQLGASREDVAGLAARLQNARAEEARCDQQLKAAMSQKIRLQTELQRLVQNAPQLPINDEDEAATLVVTQLASLQTDVQESQMNLQNAGEAYRIAEQALQEATRQVQAARDGFTEKVEEGQKLRELVTSLDGQVTELRNRRNVAADTRRQVVQRLEQLQQAVVVAAEKLKGALEAAVEVCSPEEGQQAIVNARLLAEEKAKQSLRRQRAEGDPQALQDAMVHRIMECKGLEVLLQKVNQVILKVQKDVGTNNLEELEIKLADKNKLTEIRLAAHRRIERLLEHFRTAYANQVRLFEQRRNNMEIITVNKFRSYLRRRGHEGRLHWDHKERTLKMFVKPGGKNNKEAQWVEDLKSLSGGERSFTTVAFLLAIGFSTESPFRCMDEFDVFMDAINRRVATETLLEFAYENPQYQYIFLTPQDIQAVEDARLEVMRKRGMELPAAFLKTVQLQPARDDAAAAVAH